MTYRCLMAYQISSAERIRGALYGLFIGDALAMPVHWYYDTKALRRDYGEVRDYLAPRNPHPDSILWRSSYRPPRAEADILHDQAAYWGRKGVHYHQFLEAGENTLNLQLARELLFYLNATETYSSQRWLEHFVAFMTTPRSHNDTYVEEYLRHFFTNYGRGIDLLQCGRPDEHHIGGFSLMLPLLIFYADRPEYGLETGLNHLALTHGGVVMSSGGRLLGEIILQVLSGAPLVESIEEIWKKHSGPSTSPTSLKLTDVPDQIVVGRHFSSACYVDQALPATLYLAAKYHRKPADGLVANTMCGGDNCGRGAVLGALLGAASGLSAWPERWRSGLKSPPPEIIGSTAA